MQDINETYKDKGITVLGILADENTDTAKELLKQAKVDYLNLKGNIELMEKLQVMYVPTTYFVNKDREIVGIAVGEEEMLKELERLTK